MCHTHNLLTMLPIARGSENQKLRKAQRAKALMDDTNFQLLAIRDPRLAVHAASTKPAWLWSSDGTRILWANAVGAQIFGARNATALAIKNFGPADQHRRQVIQLSTRLPPDGAMRLERLRGFGTTLGGLITCACARLAFSDGMRGILLVANTPPSTAMPVNERLLHLVEDMEIPVATFTNEGIFAGASEAATCLPGFLQTISNLDVDALRSDILRDGRVEMDSGLGRVTVHHIGIGADSGLIALIAPIVTHAPELPRTPAPVQRSERETVPPSEQIISSPVAALPISVHQTEPDQTINASINVVPFRPATELKIPVLTAGENTAFQELARQLVARLGNIHTPSVTSSDNLMPPDTRPEPAAETMAPNNDDKTRADELSMILDAITEGVVMCDHLGKVLSCNRSTEALLGYDTKKITTLHLADLFAVESQSIVLSYFQNMKDTHNTGTLNPGIDVIGRTSNGTSIPLSMTMGCSADSLRFFAVFRDMTQIRKIETELMNAQRLTNRLTNAKSGMLARISHEVRTPLNAIMGFADVMIEERFGALGNERYVEYMKDVRASGESVIAIIDNLLDLSHIEDGKLDLSFVHQDLNSLIEQCVAVMQPQAQRERIIIRTSLAHSLPAVRADARALRQIALNLIGSSIHLANTGGQVIVSTATTDLGDIVLRIRNTGPGLNDNEIATAMQPFHASAATDQMTSDNAAVNLSLTKALVEANRAKLRIKSASHSGTLIEVVFSRTHAMASIS